MQLIRLPLKQSVHVALAVWIVAACGLRDLRAAELSLPIQTTVKSIQTAKVQEQPNPMVAGMGQPEPALPTLPSGKLPQYQLGRDQLIGPSEADIKTAKRRLLIALPQQLLLVEASITIDGEPFAMAREKRVQDLLETADKGVEKREVETAAPVIVQNEAEPESEQESEQDSVDESSEEAKEEADELEESESPEVIPPKVASFARVSSTEDFVRRYYATTKTEPSAEEIRWLITHRIDGPVLLMLDDNFQRFRAGERPAFDVLDRDLDGTVSKEELAKVVDSFERCDENQNEIIEYRELEAAANRLRNATSRGGVGKLVSQIPTATTATAIYRRLASHYDAQNVAHNIKGQSVALARFDTNENGKFDSDEIEAFSSVDPDLELDVSFNSLDASQSKIAVSGISKTLIDSVSDPESMTGSISLRIGRPTEPGSAGTTIAFSAIQKQASDQVAVGAVSDGYPVLPTLDPNQDGMFTVRERRQLVERVKKIDLNKDGTITKDEAQSTIRVCFALGPYVHQELASLRTTGTPSVTQAIAGPEWFTRMDRNGDNDVSPGEFSGNEEQFAALDVDDDELISAVEANAFDAKSKEPNSQPKSVKPATSDSSTSEQ